MENRRNLLLDLIVTIRFRIKQKEFRMFSISEFSRETGVSTQTIRYYERIGLLPEPHRSANGYRLYDDEDISRVRFIKQARFLKFTLDDIAAFQQDYIKGKNFNIVLIGSKDKINFKALQPYGNVKELTLDEIFGYEKVEKINLESPN